ncbi:unnamed protein product [Aureobasidium uvarum]|uniref:Uncharacterized protein n=1 Tax=Aureobasidium uvarum TaxID=2773716 RepID=A0A9N8KG77_9PEZI|nr:unnamed protein product [Aureobasidium uvarum]
MSFCETSMPSGLSPSQRLQVMGTYMYSQCSTTALTLARSLLGQKRKCDSPEDDNHDVDESTTGSEAPAPFRNLRKRPRVSYVEPTEFDIESDADSGYNSDSSVEWGSCTKQTKNKRPREKPVKPFPFLSLPTELRNKIYLLALQDPDGMVLNEGWRAYRRVPQRGQYHRYNNNNDRYDGLANLNFTRNVDSQGNRLPDSTVCTLLPSLLAVSKQIYAEAAAILYAQPLHFENTTALHSFLAPLSSQTASLIRSITIHTYETWGRGIRKAMNVSALTLLRSCSNLQMLRIEAFDHYNHWGRYGARPSAQEAGKREGSRIAQQIYRDAAFWLDTIDAEKALQILDLKGLQREIHPNSQHPQEYDRAVETLKVANSAYADELTSLIMRTGKAKKSSRKSKAAFSSD